MGAGYKFIYGFNERFGFGHIVRIHLIVYGILCLLYMKFTGLAGLGVNSAVVINAVSNIACFLHFNQQIARSYGMNASCREKKYIAGV